MSMDNQMREQIQRSGFLKEPGLWALTDGQFGSTGKGLAASVLAEALGKHNTLVTSNAGPNSGHTSYGPNGQKVVLQQLPTFAVACKLYHGISPAIYMNAGAIINVQRFNEEFEQWINGALPWVHPAAAFVDDSTSQQELELIKRIGSTGKGTGAALARKVLRETDATVNSIRTALCANIAAIDINDWGRVFMEVSQGYSLSLNASGMYPYTTSRDCTLIQGMADAGAHPNIYKGGIMVIRTFPIRVAGNSGPCYADQHEISWEELRQEPEKTTVTQKTRRVFTFSDEQFRRALKANQPCSLLINFVQYLPEPHQDSFIDRVLEIYERVLMMTPRLVLLGYGPKNEDVRVHIH
jgi:adenylosuccinate synthase